MCHGLGASWHSEWANLGEMPQETGATRLARFFLNRCPMRTPGRLALVLNGIVISSLTACGGTPEGDHQLATAGQGAGGDTAPGGALGESGSGGRVQIAGASSGGSVFVAQGGTVGMGGAGTAGSGGGGNVIKMSTPLCDEQGLLRFVEGLHLAVPVDYLAVYLSQSVGNTTIYQSTGTLCSGASDKVACQAAFMTGAPSAGFSSISLYPPAPSNLPFYSYLYVAYTRGDNVGFIVDRTQLNAFLGEIDTPNEAGLVFLTMGVGPACNAISETEEAYYYSTPYASGGCPITPPGHLFSVTHAGDVLSTPVGMAMPCVGRRPVGLVSEQAAAASPLGDYYASIAYLEGAAVLAFDVMERELQRFGAPRELQLRARRAREDEVRHYARMAAVARREGATVPTVRAEVTSSERPLLAAALENAVEGCVREAWGALSAHYQAATAAEPEARLLWESIATDETEHAELSLALHEWYMQQLALEERSLVEAAMQRARLELRSELALGTAPHPIVAHQVGVPGPSHAAALFDELERQVLVTLVQHAA